MTQPGWYPDPSSPFSMRWWDGKRWTNDTAEETKTGGLASKALLFGAFAYSGQFLLDALVIGPIWHAYRQWIDALQTNSAATLVLPRGAVALDGVSSVASLVLVIVAVFFLIWFQKAAKVAARRRQERP